MGEIVIIAGPPGAGKTTIADRLSRAATAPLTLHLHTDDFFSYMRNGAVEAWRPEANYQNLVVAHALSASAAICGKAGYQVYVDGVVLPRALQIWRNAASSQELALHYVLLMPSEAAAVERVLQRTGPKAMNDRDVARLVWRTFQNDPAPAASFVDSTHHTVEETVEVIWRGLAESRFQIS